MPAAVPIMLAITAATAVGGAIEANQTAQHAKGAAQAQAATEQAQITQATATDKATQTTQAQTAQAGAAQKMAAALASMSQQGSMGGTNTGASSVPPAQTTSKSLLGA